MDWYDSSWTGFGNCSQAPDGSPFLPVWEAQSHDQPQMTDWCLGRVFYVTPPKGPPLERQRESFADQRLDTVSKAQS